MQHEGTGHMDGEEEAAVVLRSGAGSVNNRCKRQH